MKKWTNDIRKYVFQSIYNKFGAVNTWAGGSYPKDKKHDFDKLLKDLSVELNKKFNIKVAPTAISNQININFC